MNALVQFNARGALQSARSDGEFVAIAAAIREYGLEDLQRYTNARDLADARAKVIAVQEYLRRAMTDRDAQLAAQNDLAELRTRQERRLGEMLRDSVEHGGDRRSDSRCPNVTLNDIGVSRKQSSRWQRAASLPDEDFEEYIAETREAGKEITAAGVAKLARQAQARATVEPEIDADDGCRVVSDLGALIAEGERFATIYADPPWAYANQGTRAATGNHYGTMGVGDIAALPVRELADDNAQCHMWTTNAFLFDAKAILEAWGFEYKSVFVWCKPQMGIGNYWRVSHEFLVLGVRGRQPFRDRGLRSWAEIDRSEHSAKPELVRERVERASPGPYLELFGRRTVPGWTVFGNQVSRRLFVRET